MYCIIQTSMTTNLAQRDEVVQRKNEKIKEVSITILLYTGNTALQYSIVIFTFIILYIQLNTRNNISFFLSLIFIVKNSIKTKSRRSENRSKTCCRSDD